MTRQEANRKIISRLAALNEAHADQRFGQLLVNAGVTSPDIGPKDRQYDNLIAYYEESSTILERVQKACERLFYGSEKS